MFSHAVNLLDRASGPRVRTQLAERLPMTVYHATAENRNLSLSIQRRGGERVAAKASRITGRAASKNSFRQFLTQSTRNTFCEGALHKKSVFTNATALLH